MILFDTSVVIDARNADSPWHEWAKQLIAEAGDTEGAVVNTVVIAEAAVYVKDREHFAFHLEKIGLTLLPLPVSAAAPAAKAFAIYMDRLKAEGKTRASKIPLGDFFIGAHAEAEGMKLVTRDPDQIRTYFPSVKLIVPSKRVELTSAPRLQFRERRDLVSKRTRSNHKASNAIREPILPP